MSNASVRQLQNKHVPSKAAQNPVTNHGGQLVEGADLIEWSADES
ncbi:hypothetical protein V7794_03985 [Rhizobium laguerreae]|uniref:Uncharacterized protein n=1 Tax=Rhizobium laguerreae TaxID=1076926 RepID=A0AAX2QFI5_9HYPH|nr:hypothetical protein [Rhizobium laguerreae]TCU19550.1 hypothetical protein EV131_113150 [Rhizobium laguerreae]